MKIENTNTTKYKLFAKYTNDYIIINNIMTMASHHHHQQNNNKKTQCQIRHINA